jgi:hypothetical protein
MKIAGLVIGILLMVVSGIAFVVCLMLPAITSNKVNFEESLVGLIPAAFFCFVGLVVTVVSGILVLKGKKAAQEPALEG